MSRSRIYPDGDEDGSVVDSEQSRMIETDKIRLRIVAIRSMHTDESLYTCFPGFSSIMLMKKLPTVLSDKELADYRRILDAVDKALKDFDELRAVTMLPVQLK